VRPRHGSTELAAGAWLSPRCVVWAMADPPGVRHEPYEGLPSCRYPHWGATGPRMGLARGRLSPQPAQGAAQPLRRSRSSRVCR
jgi:hypothetical protein